MYDSYFDVILSLAESVLDVVLALAAPLFTQAQVCVEGSHRGRVRKYTTRRVVGPLEKELKLK